jgi:hypothetical protein
MFKWLKRWQLRHNPYIGIFRGWHRDRFNLRSPNGDYSLWIANGLSYFKDCDIRKGNKKLLIGLSDKERKILWQAAKHDMEQDALEELATLRDVEP